MKPSPRSFNQSGFLFYKSPSFGGGKGVEFFGIGGSV
jgi:hypothetical protein